VFGAETDLLIDLIVINLDCSVCDGTKKGKVPDPNHVCSKVAPKFVKNMEIDAVLEAFSRSQAKHGLVYDEVVADGDTRIVPALQSIGIHVKKHDDVIHVLRKYQKNLKTVSSQSQRILVQDGVIENYWVNICQPAKGRNHGFSDSSQIFFGDSLSKL
jgi:hypothetical protein